MDSTIGSEYNGFVVVGNYHFKEDNAEGIYLRHKESGLEVFHILDNSKENGFAFAFRTVAKNSKGNAHILEHSVLCGSEKYDLKEPFTTLNNQSVLTFSNAFTYPEKTVYPASSVVKKDYYTAFDVYADAVFFPRLTKQTFMQEGWRVEYDENGNPSIQGVVYNEMKGAYSDPTSIKYEGLLASVYPESHYKHNSGGNPANIPELSYEDFVAFHDKFYSPSNCLLVVMGNIPTEEQLDHINETLTSRLVAKYGTVKFNKKNVAKVPADIKKLLNVEPITEPTTAVIDNIGSAENGESVSIAYATNLDDTRMDILNGVLFGEQTSPFVKYMLDNGNIGVISNLNGKLGTGKDSNVFNIGFDNVKSEDEQKAFDFIDNLIHKVYEEGFSKEAVDAVIMKESMSRRSESRYAGAPLSMGLAINIIDNWVNGRSMDTDVESIEALSAVEEEINKNPSVIMDWYKDVFINNTSIVKIISKPGDKFVEEQKKAEQKNLDRLLKGLDKDAYAKELEELHAYQSKVETSEDTACIPKSSTNDLTDDLIQDVGGNAFDIGTSKPGKYINCLANTEHTLGITKLEVMFPIDNLPPKDLKYVSLISDLADFMGTKNQSWEEVVDRRAKVMNFNLSIDDYATTSKSLHAPDVVGNRYWFTALGCFLNKNSTEAVKCIADFINNTSFNDTERFQSMLKEFIANSKTDMPNNNHSMMLRNVMDYNKYCAMDELMWGVSYSKFILGLDPNDTKKLQKKLNKVFKAIKKSGMFIHYVTDNTVDLTDDLKLLVKSTNAVPPKPAKDVCVDNILKYAYYPKDYDPEKVLTIKTDVLVGFASRSYKTGDFWGSYQNACRDLAFSHMGMHQLWEKVRTMNGAYGAHALNNSMYGHVIFSSYRDPNPRKSLDLFRDSANDLRLKGFSKEDLESSALSCFSDYTIPGTAFDRGELGLKRFLRGTSNELVHNMVNNKLHNVRADDVENEVNKVYASMIWNCPRQLVVVPKSDTTTENVIEL